MTKTIVFLRVLNLYLPFMSNHGLYSTMLFSYLLLEIAACFTEEYVALFFTLFVLRFRIFSYPFLSALYFHCFVYHGVGLVYITFTKVVSTEEETRGSCSA